MTTEQIECCICYETIGDKNNCVTPCGHKFCFVCLTKALVNNNTCPCCREVLVEQEDDDESEYETEDSDGDSDDESDFPRENWINFQDVSLEDINDIEETVYDKMIKGGITKTEIVRLLTSYYSGGYLEYEGIREIDNKIEYSFSNAFADTIRENRIKNEQMMFLQEDKISNINALDMIALNYA